jgi:outer membrane protein assembly factor BamA
LGFRYDIYDNVTLGLELGHKRLTRSGLGVRGVINLGEPNEYRLSLTHVDPFVLPFSSHITAYWSSIDRSYYIDRLWIADYNVDVRGGTIGLANHIGGNAFIELEFPVKQSLYRYPADSIFQLMPDQEWTAGPSLKIEVDRQDDPFLPNRGLRVVLRADCGLPKIGDAKNFTRIELTVNQYIPLTSWSAFFYNFDCSGSWGDLPWSGYFSTGGDNFAGYKPECFTSRNKTQAGLGLAFSVSRMFNKKDDAIVLKVEADFAGFRRWDHMLDVAEDELGHEFHVGAGPALFIKTPLGPVQFKVGWANLYPQYNRDIPRWPTALFVSFGKDFRYTK